jgi:hypothetical protein
MNPHHYAPGNHAPALLRQLPWRGHPRHCAMLCGRVSNNPVALCHPVPYGRRAAPSKKDDGALEGKTSDYSTPAQDCVVTSGQLGRSPLSPSALCDHPRHRDAIPDTAPTSLTPWERAVIGRRHDGYCDSYSLTSTAPSSPHADGHRTGDLYAATLEAAPGRTQDAPCRLAGCEIRQDGRLLHDVVHHASTRRRNSAARF